MKAYISMLLVFIVLFSFSVSWAEGVEVQIIGAIDTVSMDDLKVGSTFELDELGIVTITAFDYRPWVGQYTPASHHPAGRGAVGIGAKEGGQLAVIKCDITNTTLSKRDYLEETEVKVVFDGEYEITGWCGQINYDNEMQKHADFGWASGIQNTEYSISKEDQFAIEPFYTGHYCFVVDIPNFIINSENQLEMIICIDEQELIYRLH